MTGILQFITRRPGATAAILIGLAIGTLLLIYAVPIVKEQQAIRLVREVGHVETRPAGPEWLATRFGDAEWWPREADFVLLPAGLRGAHEARRSLRDMRSLESVSIEIDAVDLAELLRFIADGSAETLTTLGLHADGCRGARLSVAAGTQLARLRRLEQLSLWNVEFIDSAFQYVANLRRLQGLSITACGRLIGDDGFASLGKLTELRRLELRDFQSQPESFQHLRNLASLTDLILVDSDCDDRALRHLSPSNWPALESLYLRGTRVTDAGLDAIANFRSLQLLDLADTKITDHGVAKLDLMPFLESLILERTAVTPACRYPLGTLPNLRYLYLKGTAINDGGVHQQEFQESLPDVRIEFTDSRWIVE